MKNIHQGLPGREFDLPSKIETAEICPITGLLATDICKNAYTEYFLDGTVPKEYCVDHSNVKENVIVNENTNSVDSENVFEQ